MDQTDVFFITSKYIFTNALTNTHLCRHSLQALRNRAAPSSFLCSTSQRTLFSKKSTNHRWSKYLKQQIWQLEIAKNSTWSRNQDVIGKNADRTLPAKRDVTRRALPRPLGLSQDHEVETPAVALWETHGLATEKRPEMIRGELDWPRCSYWEKATTEKCHYCERTLLRKGHYWERPILRKATTEKRPATEKLVESSLENILRSKHA